MAAVTLNASSPGALCFGVAAFNNSPFVQSLRAQTSARKQARIGAPGPPDGEMTDSAYRELIRKFTAILKQGVQYEEARTAVQNSGVTLHGDGDGGSDQDWLRLQIGIVSVFNTPGTGRDLLDRIFLNVLQALKPNDMANRTETEQIHDYIRREGRAAARYNRMGPHDPPSLRRQNAVPHSAPPVPPQLVRQRAFFRSNNSGVPSPSPLYGEESEEEPIPY